MRNAPLFGQLSRGNRRGNVFSTRITDEELRAAVDRMTRVALATVTSD